MTIRTPARLLQGAIALLSCTALSACGGWVDEGECLICAPEQKPGPAPTAATIYDVTPPGTGSNTDRVVWSQQIDDGDATGTLSFRLVQAAREINLGQPHRVVDATQITSAGATLSVVLPEDPNADEQYLFTIKDPGMGVENVALTPDENSPALLATLPDGRTVRVALEQPDRTSSAGLGDELNWTAYGSWNVTASSGAARVGSYVVTGNETPDGNIPTTGTATFNGFVQGSVVFEDGTNLRTASLSGDATMTADFANGTIAGGAPNITAIPLGEIVNGATPTPGPAQAWNGLTFSGTMTSGLNGFSGTTTVSSAPGNSYSLSSAADGYFAGLFYGPNANELGAIWNLADDVSSASGVLVGKQ